MKRPGQEPQADYSRKSAGHGTHMGYYPDQAYARQPAYMARNIEIKASVRSVSDLLERVSRFASSAPMQIEQDDTFFRCNNGRLKLRSFSSGSGELMFYRRADTAAQRHRTTKLSRRTLPIHFAARLHRLTARSEGCATAHRLHGRTHPHTYRYRTAGASTGTLYSSSDIRSARRDRLAVDTCAGGLLR